MDNSVSESVECCVCFELLQAPIRICLNGHSICNPCRLKLEHCPYCTQPFEENATNYKLEEILKQLQRTPEVKELCDGCCPFATRLPTRWNGSQQKLFAHVRESHKDILIETKGNFKYSVPANATLENEWKLIIFNNILLKLFVKLSVQGKIFFAMETYKDFDFIPLTFAVTTTDTISSSYTMVRKYTGLKQFSTGPCQSVKRIDYITNKFNINICRKL